MHYCCNCGGGGGGGGDWDGGCVHHELGSSAVESGGGGRMHEVQGGGGGCVVVVGVVVVVSKEVLELDPSMLCGARGWRWLNGSRFLCGKERHKSKALCMERRGAQNDVQSLVRGRL